MPPSYLLYSVNNASSINSFPAFYKCVIRKTFIEKKKVIVMQVNLCCYSYLTGEKNNLNVIGFQCLASILSWTLNLTK